MKVTIKTLEDFPEVPEVEGQFGTLDLAKQAATVAGNGRHDKTAGCTMCILGENGEELARVELGDAPAAPAEDSGEDSTGEEKKPDKKKKKKKKKKK